MKLPRTPISAYICITCELVTVLFLLKTFVWRTTLLFRKTMILYVVQTLLCCIWYYYGFLLRYPKFMLEGDLPNKQWLCLPTSVFWYVYIEMPSPIGSVSRYSLTSEKAIGNRDRTIKVDAMCILTPLQGAYQHLRNMTNTHQYVICCWFWSLRNTSVFCDTFNLVWTRVWGCSLEEFK